jgi:hypothetical protein
LKFSEVTLKPLDFFVDQFFATVLKLLLLFSFQIIVVIIEYPVAS